MSRLERGYHQAVVSLVLLILVLPLLATLGYALATEWGATILPRGLTPAWFIALWSDSRFLVALSHSLLICGGALLFSLLLVLPAMFVITWAFPRLDAVMNILILLPFSVPPVLSSVGLLQLYSSGPIAITGTPWILIGCYFTIALPFIRCAVKPHPSGRGYKARFSD